MSRNNTTLFLNKTTFGNSSEIDELESEHLEAESTFQDYLYAQILSHKHRKIIKATKKDIEMHLIERLKELQNTCNELSTLEANIEEIALKLKQSELKNKVKLVIDEAEKVLTNDLIRQLEKTTNILNDKVENLYLKNVQCPQTVEDIEKLNASLLNCKNLLEEIHKSVPNKELLEMEASVLREFKTLEGDYLKKRDANNELDDTLTTLTLKIVSDKLQHIE